MSTTKARHDAAMRAAFHSDRPKDARAESRLERRPAVVFHVEPTGARCWKCGGPAEVNDYPTGQRWQNRADGAPTELRVTECLAGCAGRFEPMRNGRSMR